MTTTLGSSPPVLPIHRQPSPLSFSSVSFQDPPSPRASSTSPLPPPSPDLSSAPSSRILQHESFDVPFLPEASPHAIQRNGINGESSRSTRLPLDPAPDSMLLRSTFNSLEHSSSTLKRMSKTVLASTRAYFAALEQVEKAEDELFQRLGELARWLENGYELAGESIWGEDQGIRKLKREARRRERDELEVMVEQGVRAVKGELKRNGLAGHGAQARFENTARSFYSQTSEYLSPQTPNSHPTSHSVGQNGSQISNSSRSSANRSSAESAQAARLAQFDLARYSHHSTLLYSVPPTSIPCLDLLVGLDTWAGSFLGEDLDLRHDGGGRRGTEATLRISKSPILESSTMNSGAAAPTKVLKAALSSSLSQLASIRTDLLDAWSTRNQQTAELEEIAAERQADVGILSPDLPATGRRADPATSPNTTAGIENKKPRRMHQLHRSVGGKLRDLLSSSASTTNLVLSNDAPDRTSRASMDVQSSREGLVRGRSLPVGNPLNGAVGSPGTESDAVPQTPTSGSRPPIPERRPSASLRRPSLQPRHSMHATRPLEYVTPFMASQSAEASAISSASSIDLRAPPMMPAISNGPARLGGVGGLGAGGDEDERREQVGRKKEGVLWGAGVWENLSGKGSSRSKWENFWVVLDRSSIYEYRDSNFNRPEGGAHAVIDLKFASVREGRGTDRRFVFEIVTPTQGRRLYQATSEQEMTQWLYAICNAIESCINGTSSVRTFDASKLRTVSGSLDDHALPTRRLFPGPQRGLGIGLPLPSIPGTPGSRRSMPPPPRQNAMVDAGDKRQRKPSLKKVLRQSAEIAGEKWNIVMNHRNPSGLDLPRPAFLAQTSRSSSGKTSTPIEEDVGPVSMAFDASTTSHTTRTSQASRSQISDRSSWLDDEGQDDVEKRVLEMDGFGLGASPGSAAIDRRAVSDIPPKSLAPRDNASLMDIARTRSADAPPPLPSHEQVDMKMLRAIADLPDNSQCADCRRSMKSSRWATLSLRDVPMVMFLCIRCVGVHRGLGTHISKPRSVDLDIWTPESILLAKQWGNARGNAMWEAMRFNKISTSDDAMGDIIRAKYVEGRWLSADKRAEMGLSPAPPAAVGRAL